ASRARTGLPAQPTAPRDRHELVESGFELLRARPLEPLGQDRDELGARAALHEDDEAKAETLLVRAVQLGELREHRRVLSVLLRRALADARVRRERLELLLVRERARDLACP